MRGKSSRIAVIGVGAVLIAAGFARCGGSSDDESSGVLSKEDFVAQANEICSGVSPETAAAAGEFTKAYQAGDYEASAAALTEATDVFAGGIDEIEALEPPEEDAANRSRSARKLRPLLPKVTMLSCRA